MNLTLLHPELFTIQALEGPTAIGEERDILLAEAILGGILTAHTGQRFNLWFLVNKKIKTRNQTVTTSLRNWALN